MRGSPSLTISPSHYEKVKFLGSGSVGKVYLTRNKKLNQLFAIKFVRHCALSNDEISRTVKKLASISHPCLCSITGFSLPDPAKKRPLAFVTPMAENNSLEEFLSAKNTLSDEDKIRILFGVAEGMRHLEENGITHGNLTMRNILLNGIFEPMIADFGLDPFRENHPRIPQMRADADQRTRVDVFCYGIILYTLITGIFIEGDELPLIDATVPGCFQRILARCWHTDPLQRPFFSGIVMMFLNGELELPRCRRSSIVLSYQSRVLSPSFATQTLIGALEQINILIEQQKQMQEHIQMLEQRFDQMEQADSPLKPPSGGRTPGEVTFDIDEPPETDVKTAMNPLQVGQRRLPVAFRGNSNWSVPMTSRRFSTRYPIIPVESKPRQGEREGAGLLFAPEKTTKKPRRNSLQPPIPQNNFEVALDMSGYHPEEGSEAMSDPLERTQNDHRRGSTSELMPSLPPAVAQSADRLGHVPSLTEGGGGANIRPKASLSRLPKDFDAQVQFPYTYLPFDGIFAHMTDVDMFVNITGNSVDKNRDTEIRKVINFEWKKCWTSENMPNSFIQFDFAPQQVSLTHYSIKTYQCGKGYSHLKSWVLEGTNPGASWSELDRREDNQDLNGKSKVATFSISNNGVFQVVRLRQIGPNHYGDNYLIVTNIEFFGDVL